MPRYIDADALLEYVLSGRWKLESQTSEVLRIQRAPTADVQEVKHGKWGYHYEGTPLFRCSLCGKDTQYEENYCPKCGAKMDGGEGDDG